MKHIVGYENGTKYMLIKDKLGNQQACDETAKNSMFWFLWVKGEYVGHYRLKSEALSAINGANK